MNRDEQQAWVNETLDLIFEALAQRESVREILIFKGARVLHRRLGAAVRQSYDIDANLTRAFVEDCPQREDQRKRIEQEFARAIDGFFASREIVRFKLERVTVYASPVSEHPLGWNAFRVRINVRDSSRPTEVGLPALYIDVAAPEDLTERSVAELAVGSATTLGYTLSRIAGEKCRAFLSSLPSYREKARRPGDAVRAKDVYDLSRIVAERPLADTKFWEEVGIEFRIACKARFIDCEGMETFEEALDITAATYDADASIPKDVSFAEAWGALSEVVRFFEQTGVVPFATPMPS